MPTVKLRAALALVAVLVLAWLGVLLRDHEVGTAAVDRLANDALPRAEADRELDHLRDAEILSPDSEWQAARAEYLVNNRRLAEAAREAEQLVAGEPENVEAWIVLALATSRSDRRRSAQALAEIKRLSPFGTG